MPGWLFVSALHALRVIKIHKHLVIQYLSLIHVTVMITNFSRCFNAEKVMTREISE